MTARRSWMEELIVRPLTREEQLIVRLRVAQLVASQQYEDAAVIGRAALQRGEGP